MFLCGDYDAVCMVITLTIYRDNICTTIKQGI